MTDFEALLSTLNRNRVEYIVVGPAAAIAHGSARFTQDLDVVYNRTPDNLDRRPGALHSSHFPVRRHDSRAAGARNEAIADRLLTFDI